MRYKNLLAIALTLALAAPAPHAQAQAHDIPVELSETAYAAFTAGRFEDAVRLFEAAISVDPHPVLRFNHARALEELRRLPGALAIYRALSSSDFERVRVAAIKRSDALARQLRDEGYDPRVVTDRTYRRPAPVRVVSNAPDAEVFLNGRVVGSGDDLEFRHPSGTYQLYVYADGYYPYRASINVPDGGASFTALLEPRTSLTDYVAPPPGLMTIAGPANGMAIYIDGVLNDKLTPAREILLPEGRYDLLIRHPLYDDYSTSVFVRAGVETRIDATNVYSSLEPQRRLTERQRVGNALIAVGSLTVVAGVGVGVGALIAKNDYDRNPNAPNRFEARDRARSLATGADVLFAVGGVTAGTGIALRVLRPKARGAPTEYDERLLDLSLGTSGTPIGATLTWRR